MENSIAVKNQWTQEQIDTIKKTVAAGASEAELQMFLPKIRRKAPSFSYGDVASLNFYFFLYYFYSSCIIHSYEI